MYNLGLKSVKNFALSYPQNTYPRIWYHDGLSRYSTMVNVVVKLAVRNDPVGFQFAFGANGEYFQ